MWAEGKLDNVSLRLACTHYADPLLKSRGALSLVIGDLLPNYDFGVHAHAQLKESDRVGSMLQLRKMGARVEFDGNDMEFEGVWPAARGRRCPRSTTTGC